MVMQKLNTGVTATLTKVLLGVVLFSALLGLAMTDVGGFFRNGVSRSDIAKVGSTKISVPQFAHMYQRRLEQSGMDDNTARQMGVPTMILRQEIDRQLLLQAAKKSGIRVSNAYVANQLKTQLDNIKMVGTPAEKLRRVLMQQKITEKELVELLRGDFSINLLGSAIATNEMNVPSQMTLAAYRSAKQKRGADLISVTSAVLKNQKALTDKEVEDFYNEHKESYRMSETRDLNLLIIPQSAFAKPVTVSDADVKAYYDQNKAKFLSAERVKLAQLIVSDETTAKKIIAEKPASLEKYQNGNQYLKADWYGKNGLPQEFTAVLYPNKPTGMIGPVKTSLGYHVVLVEAYEEPKPMSFEQAKANIQQQLKDEKLDEQMTQFTNDIDSMIASNSSLEEIAAKYKLKTKHLTSLQNASAKKQLDDAGVPAAMQQRVQDAAFSLDADEVSPLMDTPSGDYAMAQVTKINPSTIPELKTIEAKVKLDATKARDAKAMNDFAENLMSKYDIKNQKAFDKAVAEAGVSVQSIPAVTKEDANKQYGRLVAETLFGLDPSDGIASFQTADKVTLVRLRNTVASTETPDAKEQEAAKDTLRGMMQQEIQQQFVNAWQKDIPVGVNMTVMQANFGPQTKEQ